MLVNHFKFRHDIESYSLGGMGCGNGVIGIGLLKNLLQVRRGSWGHACVAIAMAALWEPTAALQYWYVPCSQASWHSPIPAAFIHDIF
jgi:hypothetical protein